jgi:hypothetical protein
VLTSQQNFEVFGLRFSLPPGAVHQTYPPQGHGDHSEVLPHIVFNDAHLPWERDISNMDPPLTKKPRNLTPWLALLVFTEDELRLAPEQLTAMGAGQKMPSGITSLTPSNTTLDVNMTLGNVLNLKNTAGFHCPVLDDDPLDPIDQSQAVNMIFPSGDLFTALFCSYDDKWNRILPGDATSKKPDLSRYRYADPFFSPSTSNRADQYRYMAHVRQVSHANMTDNGNLSGSTDEGVGEDEGVYSIIISHRTGPLQAPKRLVTTPKPVITTLGPVVELPKSVIVHLVSLQGIEDNIALPIDDPSNSRVALVSLYSWIYTVLPPLGANFLDSMRAIGNQIPTESLLRGPDFRLNSLKTSAAQDDKGAKIAQRLHARAIDGTSIIRYMPQTGEETISFYRGALCPTLPKHALTPFWPTESNFSTNLQILDRHLGMTDITYSAAWELGRTLAMADRAFTSALNRLRHAVNIYATNESKKAIQGANFTSKARVISNLKDSVRLLARIPQQLSDGSRAVDPVRRWTVSDTKTVVPPTSVRRSEDTRPLFTSKVHEAMNKLASSNTTAGDATFLPFNEINVPNSPDWAIVLRWIVDKMYLYNIPAHYLIPDPSYLSKESIRFFYVDPNWIDALIDGALSVGNHLESKDDTARQAFKFQLNRYFSNPMDDAHPFNPQIPIYGFLLRSGVVQAYPNLEVHAPWHPDPNAPWAELVTPEVPKDPRIQVLRQDLLDKDIMFCLFDRQPGSPNFKSIVIAQPPHQQRYTIAKNFGPSRDPDDKGANEVEVEFRKVYTTSTLPTENAWTPLDIRTWVEGVGEKQFSIEIDEDPSKPPIKTPVKKLDTPNPSAIFDFDSNTVIVPAFAQACKNTLVQEMPQFFTDSEPSSALVGIQLADTINYLHISLSDPTNPTLETRKIPLPPIPNQSVAREALKAIQNPPGESTAATEKIEFQPSKKPPLPAVKAPPPPNATQKILPLPPRNKPAQFTKATQATSVTATGIISGQFTPAAFAVGHAKTVNKSLPVFPSPTYPTQPNPNQPLDLIFAFIPISSQIGNLQLNLLTVQIPLGHKPTDLLASYDIEFGAGARMLANQRFNPFISQFTQPLEGPGGRTQDWLIVTLVPRSLTQLVRLQDNPDVSFVLNQVVLNGVVGRATCLVHEGYAEIANGVWQDTATGGGKIVVDKVAAG